MQDMIIAKAWPLERLVGLMSCVPVVHAPVMAVEPNEDSVGLYQPGGIALRIVNVHQVPVEDRRLQTAPHSSVAVRVWSLGLDTIIVTICLVEVCVGRIPCAIVVIVVEMVMAFEREYVTENFTSVQHYSEKL